MVIEIFNTAIRSLGENSYSAASSKEKERAKDLLLALVTFFYWQASASNLDIISQTELQGVSNLQFLFLPAIGQAETKPEKVVLCLKESVSVILRIQFHQLEDRQILNIRSSIECLGGIISFFSDQEAMSEILFCSDRVTESTQSYLKIFATPYEIYQEMIASSEFKQFKESIMPRDYDVPKI